MDEDNNKQSGRDQDGADGENLRKQCSENDACDQ